MKNFEYNAPTKVIFGKDTENKVGELVKKFGGSKVLIHYGGESAMKSGLLERVKNSLKKCSIPFESLGGVKPNPRLSLVYEGIELSKKSGIDFILAVGGGSVIDSAKAIALGVSNNFDVWDLFKGIRDAEASLPVASILTIAAAGSEMSNGAVITNEDGYFKRSYGNSICRPKFAIMNPTLTYTLPDYQTSSGVVDIMMHTMERYFTIDDSMEITDSIAESLLKVVMKNVKIVLDDPENYNARAEIMWSGSLSHNDLTGCGSIGDWACHNIEHELGGMFDIAHGAGLSAIWGSWARYVYKEKPSRFAKFAVNVLDIKYTNDDETAIKGIEEMEKFYESINMPTKISDFNINLTEEQIEELADKATNGNNITQGNFKKLNKDDIVKIIQMAK